jgi:ABC-2 type transport system ATP-binding protein
LDTAPYLRYAYVSDGAGVAVLEVIGVSKSYGSRTALRDVSFSVGAGEIVALLGRNGAGKTTLVSIVAGLRHADQGTVVVGGPIGLAPQETGIYPTLTCRQNLRFFARWTGVPGRRIPEMIERLAEGLELTDLLDRQARQLSGGEQRRLHTAIALVGDPALVLLDEPTVGADVQTRGRLVEFVRSLAAAGTAVVYSTHYLAEVESLGASLVVLDGGVVVARGSIEEIKGLHAQDAQATLENAFVQLTRPVGEIQLKEPANVG